ncbi:MAG: TonB-dependent receptor [Calditrichaeota bacterium]|nr:TonB-dependent receptor [Calditrichota bacterium]
MNSPILKTLLLVLTLSLAVFAQGGISGIVSDSTTGDGLVAANVYLDGTSYGASADIDGAFFIVGVPAGTYTLRVSYLGYRDKSLPITVNAGETTRINVPLRFNLIEGEEVTITAQAEGQVAAINQQVNAKTIVNVISEEKIQELPDANAAEAVGRLPGVALERSGGEANKVVLRGLDPVFTSITIDGVRMPTTGVDRRDVDLSTIAQGSLAGIELHKAITADMDADAIAGSINFVTRKAPAERSLKIDARGAYNDIESSFGQYVNSIKFSDRFFDDNVGLQLSGNVEQRIRSTEEYDPDYSYEVNQYDWVIKDLDLTYTDEVRKRTGVSALFDFDTPDGGNIKFSNVYSFTRRDFATYRRNYPVENKEELFYTLRDQEQEIATFNTFLKGDNRLFGINADWNLAFASSRSKMPYDYTMNFYEPSLGSGDQQYSGMGTPSYEVLRTDPVNIIPYAYNNFEIAYLYDAFFRGEDAKEDELTAYLNLDRNYHLNRFLSGTFKAGGKYRSKSRSRSLSELLGAYYVMSFPQSVRLEDGTIQPKDFSNTRFSDLQVGQTGLVLLTNFLEGSPDRDLFSKYRLFPLIDNDALNEWYKLNRNGYDASGGTGNEYDRNIEPDAQFYDLDERVTSWYAMNTLDLGQKVTLITGIRAETEDNDYLSRFSPTTLSGFPVPTGNFRDTTATHKETVWLPNFHLTFRPTGFMGLRFAAYKALQRPNFNDRLENYVARQAGTFYSGNSVTLGNPGLRAAKAWNFEVNTSFYEGRFGLLSVSAFYKDIKDAIQLLDGFEFKGVNQLDSLGVGYQINNNWVTEGYFLRYPYNSDRPTRVWGFETELQTHLQFVPGLPKVLRNIVLSGNLSVVRTETTIPQQILQVDTVWIGPIPIPQVSKDIIYTKTKLSGQPDYIANFAVGYDYRGFSARLSTFYQAASNNSSVRIANSTSGNYSERIAFSRWDLSFKQRVNPLLSLYLNLYNLSDTREGSDTVNPIRNFTLESYRRHYGFSGDLGLQITL